MSETENSETPALDPEQLEIKLPGESSALKDLALWAGVLTLLTLIIYWPATTGDFIWRDDVNAANKQLLAPSALSQTWFGRWQSAGNFDRPIYRPVADTAYWIEYRLGGHDEQNVPVAMPFHIANLIFHALSAIVLWLLLRELLIPGAWLIAAVFASHPVHTEAVSWVSEQPIALSGLFFLSSTYAYLMFVKSREKDQADRASGGQGVDPAQTWGLFAGSAIAWLAAIFSAPSALVIPIVIALLLWWKKRFKSGDSLLLIPMFLIGLAFWFSDVDLHKSADNALIHESIGSQMSAIGHGFWNLGFHLLIPLRFSTLYPHGDASRVLAILAALPFVAIVALYLLRPLLGAGLFVAATITTLLVCASLNWFDPSRLSRVTDGDCYLAIIPLIALVIAFISRRKLPGPHPQTIVGGSTFVLIVLGALAWHRTYAFQNSVALWRDVLRKDPRSSFAEASLAEQLRLQAIEDKKAGMDDAVKTDLAEAIQHADSASSLDPSNAQAKRTKANVLVSEGEVAKAAIEFQSALPLDPKNVQLRNEYGSALISLGRFNESLAPLDEALALDPNSAITHRLLGEAYTGLNDPERAKIEYANFALQLDPSDVISRQKLAELLATTGHPKEAIAAYSMLLQMDQTQMNRPELWQAIARIKDQQHEYKPAAEYLETAVKLAPDDADLKKELDSENAKLANTAGTQPATMPATSQ